MSSHTGAVSGETTVPRAVIHKKILDAAESRPDTSVEQLSTAVNGASVDLVERVLDEYGDPAAADQTDDDETGAQADGDQSTMPKAKSNGSTGKAGIEHVPGVERNADDLTEKQRKVLRAIRESPDATQAELAARFDVTQSTINNRLNTIPGFDWKRRQEFVASMLEDNDTVDEETTSEPAGVQALRGRMGDLAEQVASLERQLREQRAETRADPAASPFDDPDLCVKVVRACIDDDDVTREEENRILKAVIAADGGTA